MRFKKFMAMFLTLCFLLPTQVFAVPLRKVTNPIFEIKNSGSLTYEQLIGIVDYYRWSADTVQPSTVPAIANKKLTKGYDVYVAREASLNNLPSIPESFQALVPRYWAAQYLCNIKGLYNYNLENGFKYPFTDISNYSTEQRQYMKLSVEQGIFSAPDNKFAPGAAVSYADLSNIIAKVTTVTTVNPVDSTKVIDTHLINGWATGTVAKSHLEMDNISKYKSDFIVLHYTNDSKLIPLFDDKTQYLKNLKSKNQKMLLGLSNYYNGSYYPAGVQNILASEASMNAYISQVTAMVNRGANMDGVTLDGVNLTWEFVPGTYKDSLTTFVTKLATELHKTGKTLVVTVGVSKDAKSEALYCYDYTAIGKVADYVNLITYDDNSVTSYTSGKGLIGPVSSYEYMTRCVKYMSEAIPPEKILLGLATFGVKYDLTAKNAGQKSAETILNQDIAKIKATHKTSDIAYVNEKGVAFNANDPTLKAASFQYTENGRNYAVWHESKETYLARMQLVKRFGLKGIYYFDLTGSPADIYTSFYSVFKK